MTAISQTVALLTAMHFTHSAILNPPDAVSINLIGAGGTGSTMLTLLAKMNHAQIELGHPGFYVTVWDDDVVTEANLGRQLFADAELGLNKGEALINRTNRFFGTSWKAQTVRFTRQNLLKMGQNGAANIFITCVDNVSARFEIAGILSEITPITVNHRDRPYYWLDFGNSQYTGQVVLATVGKHNQSKSQLYTPVTNLPFITEEYGDVLKESEAADSTPSCSLAEALEKQDLFINSTLANMGISLLWNLFRTGMTENRGFFLNLKDFRAQPLKVA